MLETDVELSDGSVVAEVGCVDSDVDGGGGNVIYEVDCSADPFKLICPVEIGPSSVVASTVFVPCIGSQAPVSSVSLSIVRKQH